MEFSPSLIMSPETPGTRRIRKFRDRWNHQKRLDIEHVDINHNNESRCFLGAHCPPGAVQRDSWVISLSFLTTWEVIAAHEERFTEAKAFPMVM